MFAAVCVLLAATGHILMSGTAVPWWAMAAAFASTVTTAWSLAGRERGLFAVTTVAVGVQAVLHAGFSLVQSVVHPALPTGTSFARQWAEYLSCGDGASVLSQRDALRLVTDAGLGGMVSQPPPGTDMTAMPDAGAHAHHALHAMADTASTATGAAMPGAHDMAAMSPAGMLAAHLLAAILAGLWLAYGERAAFRVLRALAGWLRAPLRLILLLGLPTTPHRPRVHVRRAQEHRRPRRLFLTHTITSRGPPTGTAVL